MIPAIFESAMCLEEGIVETATELDMALVYGLGFPPFRSGILRYADSIGIKKLIELAAKYHHLGGAFNVPEIIIEMEKNNTNFYSKI